VTVDVGAARSFLATHGRLLDRRRFELALSPSAEAAGAALDALAGYRNPDGGFGSGIEPDLRAPESQPAGALHAFEVFDEAGAAGATSPAAAGLCDWLDSVALDGGALPFALPLADPAGCAPFWVDADSTVPSLQITAAVAAVAVRTGWSDPAVAGHPWLRDAVAWCLRTLHERDEPLFAYELWFSLGVLDAVAGGDGPNAGEAGRLIDRLGATIPDDGVVPVAGGAPDEALRPIELAPLPDRPVRRAFSEEVIGADLERLAAGQQPDGGWTVDYGSFSPMASLEWRGYATVRAVRVLRANGVLA
jgi:hypothetical protein